MAILFGPWAHGADTNQQGSSVVEGAWGYIWGQNGGLYRKVFVTLAANSSADVGAGVFNLSNVDATFPISGACAIGSPLLGGGLAGAAAANCLGFLAHTISGNAMAVVHCGGPAVVQVRGGTATSDGHTIFAGNVLSFVNTNIGYALNAGGTTVAPFVTFDPASGMFARAMHTGTQHLSSGVSVASVAGGTSNAVTLNAFVMCGHWPPGHF